MASKTNLKLLAISLLLSTMLPAAAEDAATGSSGDAKKQTSSSAPKYSLGEKVRKLPQTTASFLIGTIVGTPISMVRHSANDASHAAKGMVKGMQSPFSAPLMIILGPIDIIASAFGGAVCEGPWTAMETSWAYAMDKPFSKEAFSLGELEGFDD